MSNSLTPDLIAARLKSAKLPPVHQWNPEYRGDSEMRIARDGTWFYQGTSIDRAEMVRLFATVLRRDDDGVYYLVTPVEKLSIDVEDVPFVAVEMTVHGADRDQMLVFRTNVDDEVLAGPDNPIRVEQNPDTGEPSPYVLVRDRLEALISRAVFYDLVELGVEDQIDGEACLGVWSAGQYFRIGMLEGLEE